MAGKGVELLVSPTDDNGKILAAISAVKVGGSCADLVVSLQIASLALQHRRNTNGGKRIIVFVGSPVDCDEQALKKIANQLKKNNVAIDVVSMGETDQNTEVLTNFVNNVSTNENSSLVVIGAGCERPLQEIMQSASLGRGSASGSGTSGGGDGGGFGGEGDMGFDESMDPELAMAIRISQEESRAAAEAQAAQGGEPSAADAGADAAASVADDMDEEERLMQQALAMSMQTDDGSSGVSSETAAEAAEVAQMETAFGGGDNDDDEDDEDADMAAALALSMQSAIPPQPPAEAGASASASADSGFVDPDFLREMLGQVAGDLDPEDPLIAAALAQINAQNNESKGGDSNGNGGDSKKRKGPEK